MRGFSILVLAVSLGLLVSCTITTHNIKPTQKLRLPDEESILKNANTIVTSGQNGSNLVIDIVPNHLNPVVPLPIPHRQNLAKPKRLVTAYGRGQHGCAIFGATGPSICKSYPSWIIGKWFPPKGVATVHVLVVGGGGGGASSVANGIGGSGGASGEITVRDVSITHQPVIIEVGQSGGPSREFLTPGDNGLSSSFGALVAIGGNGGQSDQGGSTPVSRGSGSDGGGGGGGGNYHKGYHGGAGGAGGMDGGSGMNGQNGSVPTDPVAGLVGGQGYPFPVFHFKNIVVSTGASGKGGAYGVSREGSNGGFEGGGGGGGGGILIDGAGPHAASGGGGKTKVLAQGGGGGSGFGAGGGGAGNYKIGTSGGAGAQGVVYVEW